MVALCSSSCVLLLWRLETSYDAYLQHGRQVCHMWSRCSSRSLQLLSYGRTLASFWLQILISALTCPCFLPWRCQRVQRRQCLPGLPAGPGMGETYRRPHAWPLFGCSTSTSSLRHQTPAAILTREWALLRVLPWLRPRHCQRQRFEQGCWLGSPCRWLDVLSSTAHRSVGKCIVDSFLMCNQLPALHEKTKRVSSGTLTSVKANLAVRVQAHCLHTVTLVVFAFELVLRL